MAEFASFPKIARHRREIVVTEKIDGTNAQVYIGEDGSFATGSRNKWITPEDDNFGFARWAKEHEEELRVGLGFGTHYGEWWGQGVGRRYGLAEKRFSLFNVHRWGDDTVRPKCCHVVPTLHKGPNEDVAIENALTALRTSGSIAAPGFMQPEGVVIFHTASGCLTKITLEKDSEPKGKQE